MKRPSFQFYPADWRNDAALRMCSIASRGLWWEMLCIMHTCEPYGHLMAAGKPIEIKELARIVGESLKDVRRWLQELEQRAVFSRTSDGVIYSRRMARDAVERDKWRDRQAKSRGKSAHVTGGVTHVSPCSSSSSSSSPSVPEPNGSGGAAANGHESLPAWWPVRDRYGRIVSELTEKIMFDVGKAVLGKTAGGQITRLRKCYHGNLRAVTDLLLQAHEKSNAGEWFAAVVKNAERDEMPTLNHEKYPEHSYA